MSAVTIRPFEARDRAAIRHLCCETADRGEPVERFFPDREMMADLLTGYYTDHEPGATWVAESAGEMIGYLTGCLDTRRYQQLMPWAVAPWAAARAVLRGMAWHRQTWRFFRAALHTWRRGGFRRSSVAAQYPAHLHLSVRKGFRGRHVGRQLLERFLGQMRTAHVPGVYAAVRDDNAPACRFFERMGFVPLSRHPVAFPEGHVVRVHHTVVYGKRC